MKHSEMAWIAWHTTSVTCSENIISLDFLATFLSKKKVTRVWVQPHEYQLLQSIILFYHTDKMNVIISEMTKYKLNL